jgi:hypothetical protein
MAMNVGMMACSDQAKELIIKVTGEDWILPHSHAARIDALLQLTDYLSLCVQGTIPSILVQSRGLDLRRQGVSSPLGSPSHSI